MARKGIDPMLIVGILVVMGLVFFATGGKIQQSIIDNSESPAVITSANTIRVSVNDKLTGIPMATINAQLIGSDGHFEIGNTNLAGRSAQLTTVGPNTFTGFLLIGNDDFAGGTTDQGPEYYYRKLPVSWVNRNTLTLPQDNSEYLFYQEGNLTLAGFDDNAAEIEGDTLSIAVGTVAVDTTEIRATISGKAAFGNPDLTNPVIVCSNTTATGITVWDPNEVRPLNHAGKVTPPGFMSGRNILGCYRLPITALTDAPGGLTTYRFGVRFQPLAGLNPTAASNVSFSFWDESRSIDDNGQWIIGIGDESDISADTDIGTPSNVGAQTLDFGIS